MCETRFPVVARERGGHCRRASGNVCTGPAGAHQAKPIDGQHAEVNSQDDAPLCFRLFEGYYSSGRPGAMSLRVRAKTSWRDYAQAASGYV